MIKAANVKAGNRLDLEGDQFADPNGDGIGESGHFYGFEFELAEVESVRSRRRAASSFTHHSGALASRLITSSNRKETPNAPSPCRLPRQTAETWNEGL
jgi:hypothetical protein